MRIGDDSALRRAKVSRMSRYRPRVWPRVVVGVAALGNQLGTRVERVPTERFLAARLSFKRTSLAAVFGK